MPNPVVIHAAVEGPLDAVVARKLIACAGGQAGRVYGQNGKQDLRRKIQGYNNAARRTPWLVLVDLDSDADCAPPLRENWLPNPAPLLCFRVAVRQVEAWLMADRASLAGYLGVAQAKVPDNPESLPNAKVAMVELARRSRRSAIRQDMVPRERSGRSVGPAYSSRLIEYVQTKWRPAVAAERSESLRRALDCLRRLIEQTA
ncbi:MAG: hypothetical protein KatS3mg102_0370 [Planctomycetota bacterium]|nr:MAG: hypothetical protein KatS3mg102_0370 [Planctomycetota bacterium]